MENHFHLEKPDLEDLVQEGDHHPSKMLQPEKLLNRLLQMVLLRKRQWQLRLKLQAFLHLEILAPVGLEILDQAVQLLDNKLPLGKRLKQH